MIKNRDAVKLLWQLMRKIAAVSTVDEIDVDGLEIKNNSRLKVKWAKSGVYGGINMKKLSNKVDAVKVDNLVKALQTLTTSKVDEYSVQTIRTERRFINEDET